MAHKFRKKPVVIEAHQWCVLPHPDWLSAAKDAGILFYGDDGVPKLKTLEGEHIVSRDDYVIKGVKGELYPCKPDIFALTYERVED